MIPTSLSLSAHQVSISVLLSNFFFFTYSPCSFFCPSLSPRILSRTSPLALPRFLKALSFASLDKEELLSPINQSTLHRCSSVRSMVSSATFGCNDDYIGLALPMDISDMFHIRDSAYFQQRISPPSEERKRFLFGDGDGTMLLPVMSQFFHRIFVLRTLRSFGKTVLQFSITP